MVSERTKGRDLAMRISGQVESELPTAEARAAFLYYMMDLLEVNAADVLASGWPAMTAEDSTADRVNQAG
jgi:hypothetical protein